MLAAVLALAACSSDSAFDDSVRQETDGPIHVHLRVSQPADVATRAWQDNDNAADAEMMNVWTVVAVDNSDNKVVGIFACKPTGDPDREIDDLVELPAGGKEYRFYSFANMSPKVVMSLLGIGGDGSASTTRGGAGNTYGTGNEAGNDGGTNGGVTGSVTAYSERDDFVNNGNNYAPNTLFDIAYTPGATVTAATAEAKTVNVAGNNFNIASSNGYGATGIPMSNVQTLTVNNGDNVELVVVRLMAKFELQVYNDKDSDVTIESFTLTDVTANANDNLKLLPSLSTTGHNTMSVVTHGDIQPNLGTHTTGDLTLYPNAAVNATTNSTTAGTPVKFTFYVNESETPTNEFHHFFLKIKLVDEAEERYVLIDNKGKTTADDNKWDYIARNDYRIIPIVLDDYKLDLMPYDFPAIGVYPCSVKEEDGIYTINFHDYGHFHLMPLVKKVSSTTGEVVPFTATTPATPYASTTWGLVENSFASSWGAWTDATKTTVYDNEAVATPFYRKGTESYITTDVDGDEVGGVPKWYANTSAPRWDPAGGTTYRPFIFGYIADPGGALSPDRKVYHEFSVYLYKQGMSTPRQMTYRLYMILDTQQMLPAPAKPAPRRQHWPQVAGPTGNDSET